MLLNIFLLSQEQVNTLYINDILMTKNKILVDYLHIISRLQ